MSKDLDLPNLLRSRLTTVATLAAIKAGELIKGGFCDRSMRVDGKDCPRDLVTEWDVKSEHVIIDSIKSHFPNHKFLAEESGESGSAEDGILWIIDPIDGTVNFANNIPIFAVSIAASFQSTILSSAIYNPMAGELFIAEKGMGAYLNGRRLRVTETSLLDKSIIGTSFPASSQSDTILGIEYLQDLLSTIAHARYTGSSVLEMAYVAAGRLDGFISVLLNPWDYASGKLMIEEAGGVCTRIDGSECRDLISASVLASNGTIHENIMRRVRIGREKQGIQ